MQKILKPIKDYEGIVAAARVSVGGINVGGTPSYAIEVFPKAVAENQYTATYSLRQLYRIQKNVFDQLEICIV